MENSRSVFYSSLILSFGTIYFAFRFEFYPILGLPLIILFIPLIIKKPDLLFFLLAFLTPLSINPADVEWSHLSLALPSEPLGLILVLFFFLLFAISDKVDVNFLKHPITILIYCFFIWWIITSFTSVHKLVSIKFIIAKIWFIIPCYFLAGVFFKDNLAIRKYIALFVFGMFLVSLFNIVHLSTYGFEDKPSQWTMQPFFKDHTIFGAILALVIPLCIGLIKWNKGNFILQWIFGIVLVVLVTGLIVTFSRAAWVSIVPALVLLLIFLFRIRFKWVLAGVAVGLYYLLVNLDPLIMEMERNKVAGSDDIVQNAESISNISSDPSNLERINRWSSAIEMWKSKPIFGFGPGTYMFEYAPYQLSGNFTSISTNFGDVGNAHSEYLGPLAESGLIGMLLFLALFISVFVIGFKAYYHPHITKEDRFILCTVLCALITYFVHGFLNNFLDTDKANNIFWPLIASVVVLDLKYRMAKLQATIPNHKIDDVK